MLITQSFLIMQLSRITSKLVGGGWVIYLYSTETTIIILYYICCNLIHDTPR